MFRRIRICWVLMKSAASSASVADATMCLMIVEVTWKGLCRLMGELWDGNEKCPPARLRAFGSHR